MTTPINQPIIIVSGLPRSGTSMLMQMLEAGGVPILADDHRQPDEDNPKGYYEFEPAKRTKHDPSWLTLARGKAVKIVYMLLYDLPSDYTYRIIFMQRPTAEVVASQQAMLKRTGRQGTLLDDDALAELFCRELARIEQWLARQDNVSVHYVNYHNVLLDPEHECKAITGFLDAGLNVPAMCQRVSPSLHRHKVPRQAAVPWFHRRALWYGIAGAVILLVVILAKGMIVRDLTNPKATPDERVGSSEEAELDRLRSLPYIK